VRFSWLPQSHHPLSRRHRHAFGGIFVIIWKPKFLEFVKLRSLILTPDVPFWIFFYSKWLDIFYSKCSKSVWICVIPEGLAQGLLAIDRVI
jgi:hypothetical protein